MNAEILHQDIQTLLEFFAKNCYRASDSKSSESYFVSISPKLRKLSSHDRRKMFARHRAIVIQALINIPSITRVQSAESKNFHLRIYAFEKNKERSQSESRKQTRKTSLVHNKISHEILVNHSKR
jgi:hypothetical protein